MLRGLDSHDNIKIIMISFRWIVPSIDKAKYLKFKGKIFGFLLHYSLWPQKNQSKSFMVDHMGSLFASQPPKYKL